MAQLRRYLLAAIAVAGCTAGGPSGDSDSAPTVTDASALPTGSSGSGDTGTVGSCFQADPTLEIGTGEDFFEALSELAPVEVVFGPQGGYHMLVAVRVCYMDPLVTVHVKLVDELSGVAVSDVGYLAPTLEEGDCCRYRANMFGYLDVSYVPGAEGMSPGEYLHDKVVVYDLRVEDDQGNEVSGSVRVTGWFP